MPHLHARLDNAIQVRDLTKTFTVRDRGKTSTAEAVQDISLSVGHGKIFGLLGPNGTEKPPHCACSPRYFPSTAAWPMLSVPGLRALFALSSGMGTGRVVIFELQAGIVERLRGAPVRPFSLLMGNVLKDVVVFLVPALIVLAVADYAGFDIHLGGLAVLLVLA